MRNNQRVFIGLMVIIFAGSAMAQSGNCTQIDNSSRPDCPGALAFFKRLQDTVKRDDRQNVASMIEYPLLTTLKHKKIRIHDRKQLLLHYDEVFDVGVRCAILKATEKEVWGNWQGFTIDGGAVWFDGVIPPGEKPDSKAPDFWTKYPFKIITVNNDDRSPCNASATYLR